LRSGAAIAVGTPEGAPTAAIGKMIAATDYVRRSPFSIGGRRGHKEWQHFAILAPGVDLLVNFSCCDDMRATARMGAEWPRLVLLVRTDTWDGDVENHAMTDARIRGGRVDLAFGHNRLVFHDGVFDISATLQERPISVELRLTPVTMPAFVPSVPMLDGPPLHWLVVPRLHTSGRLTIGGRIYDLQGAPAYHDHNWGHFLWGHDVAWEWGFVLPDDPVVPWCLTFVRLTDRARTTALSHKLLLWRRTEAVRVFREGALTLETDLSYLQPPTVFKIPRALALVAPELPTDVPRSVETHATDGQDWLTCRCEAEDLGQVLIPSETELGVTIFNEVSARATVRGRVGGEAIAFAGRSILEFIRYA
jgi:hypothetical protein